MNEKRSSKFLPGKSEIFQNSSGKIVNFFAWIQNPSVLNQIDAAELEIKATYSHCIEKSTNIHNNALLLIKLLNQLVHAEQDLSTQFQPIKSD